MLFRFSGCKDRDFFDALQIFRSFFSKKAQNTPYYIVLLLYFAMLVCQTNLSRGRNQCNGLHSFFEFLELRIDERSHITRLKLQNELYHDDEKEQFEYPRQANEACLDPRIVFI